MKKFLIMTNILLLTAVTASSQSRFNYAEQWSAIDRLMEGVLPQSAMPEIEKVRQAAIKDREYGHLIKAVTTRNTCLQMTDENPLVAVINALKDDAETLSDAEIPAKLVIYSLTGDAYLNFYNQNRWRIYERTAVTAEAESDDIETWDAARLIREITHYYRLSLMDAEQSQKTPIDGFKEALEGDEATRYLRPTLYDLLAHRAIDAWMNADLRIADFSEAHVIDNPDAFGDARSFVNMNIAQTDTLAPTYVILKIFQDLTAFRLAQNDINSLTDVNLKRLGYVKENAIFDDIDTLYEEAMKRLLETCAGQRIWAKAAYTLALHYKRKDENETGRNHYLVEAMNLAREIEKNAPLEDDRKLAAEMIKEITHPHADVSIERNLIPNQPALALMTYKNMTAAYLNVYRYNPDDLERNINTTEEIQQFLAKQEKSASYTLRLPLQTDYRQHSFETKIDALPVGKYLFVISDKPNPEKDDMIILTYSPVQVTGIKLLQRNHGDGKTEVYVVDAVSGKPLQNAQVTVIEQLYNSRQSRYTHTTRETARTDVNGTALLSSPTNNWNNRLRVVYGGDELTEDMLRVWDRTAPERNYPRAVFFTDRAIYRPGQTVYFKGILYESNNDGHNAIRARANTAVQFFDVNGREIAKQDFTSNDYGSFSGVFTIPHGLLNGYMYIRNEHGSAGFRVEEYKRPTFGVKMNPVEGDFALGDTVTITGIAEALAGYPVDGARVTFNVERRRQFRPLRNWWIHPPSRGYTRQIASGTLYTDNRGEFTIQFHAAGEDVKLNDNSIYRYHVTVDVTDISGETQSGAQDVSVSRLPLALDFRLPERIFVDNRQADKLEYPLKVTNLNGNDVAADVQVEVWALKSPERLYRNRLWQQPDTFVMQRDEFAALFPNDPYLDDARPESWEKTGRVAAFGIKTPENTGIDLNILRDAPSGWYFIKLQATGGQRNATISDSTFIRLQHGDAEIMHANEWLTVVKGGGEPGETAVFRVAGVSDASLIRYDVLFKNRVVERKWLTIGRVPQEVRIPITEEYRGGFAATFVMVDNNREYTSMHQITVPYSNKQLGIAFTTFRDRLLPGEQEKWTLTVKNKNGETETAEMVATLFDASLEQFAQHSWHQYFYSARYLEYGWIQQRVPLANPFNMINKRFYIPSWNYRMDYEQLRQVNRTGNMRMRATAVYAVAQSEPMMAMDMDMSEAPQAVSARRAETSVAGNFAEAEADDGAMAMGGMGEMGEMGMSEMETAAHAAIPLRANFSETAFFYPELRTNEQGEILIEFTIPEALTRWQMLGFAHTRDFKVGNIENSLITQKQVAISANLPRFFREGDTLVLSAKVNNLTENALNGNALLRLYDAFTMQPVDAQMLKTSGAQPFVVDAGQSAAVQWRLAVPAGLQAVTYRLTAQAGKHTDGEERSVPVLTNRALVTETMPFMVRGNERKDFRFDRLAESAAASNTLSHHSLTLEYTSNPAWYAVQALPYLMEYPYECSEQVFSRLYANTLASAIANSSPNIKRIFDQWSALPDSRALLSNLEKNQELKQALLEETPWVVQAGNETEAKKRVGLLFDLNRMANEQKTAMDKLKAMQGGNGGFPWFAGMPENRFITQHIVTGLEYLRRLGALPRNDDVNNMIERALAYCDARISEDYRNAQRRDGARPVSTEINSTQIHYLYACSFSRRYSADLNAFNYYMQQAEHSWAHFNLYEQAMIALVMHRYGKANVAHSILRSLKERAQTSDEMGMWWVDNRSGYFWNEAPIETQALLIEAFNEAGSDTRAVEEMRIWLLRNKQTTNWKTTKATVKAIYALLGDNSELLGDNSSPLDIRLNGRPLNNVVREPLRPEAGTGYVKTSWSGGDVNSAFAHLRVTNPNAGIAWGALYWQYFEDMDKITSAETNLQMTRQMFIKRNRVLEPVTAANRPNVGDIVTIRLELRADRDYEYVHLKDARAAGFEPVNALSGYRYQGGLGYYESIKDASVNFFIAYLHRGTYVFEYDLRVANAGDFSGGMTTFQCMYAPEFNAHGGGGRVSVGE